MNGKKFKELVDAIPDDDIIIVSKGNTHPGFKITGIQDSTIVGVWEIRIDDFETSDFWED